MTNVLVKVAAERSGVDVGTGEDGWKLSRDHYAPDWCHWSGDGIDDVFSSKRHQMSELAKQFVQYLSTESGSNMCVRLKQLKT